jgi:hypothetical protein
LGVKSLEENGAEKAHAREMKLPRSDGRSCSGFHFFLSIAACAGASANPSSIK